MDTYSYLNQLLLETYSLSLGNEDKQKERPEPKTFTGTEGQTLAASPN
jgi:hypothetical protein